MPAKPKLVPRDTGGPQFKIERGIPVPSARGALIKYPWAEMEVGDSLFFPAGNHPSVSAISGQWATRHGRKFTTRKVDGGVRVWRIA